MGGLQGTPHLGTGRGLEPLRSGYDIAPLEQRIGDAYGQTRLLGQGLRVVGLACLCGLALAVASTRVLSGMLSSRIEPLWALREE